MHSNEFSDIDEMKLCIVVDANPFSYQKSREELKWNHSLVKGLNFQHIIISLARNNVKYFIRLVNMAQLNFCDAQSLTTFVKYLGQHKVDCHVSRPVDVFGS